MFPAAQALIKQQKESEAGPDPSATSSWLTNTSYQQQSRVSHVSEGAATSEGSSRTSSPDISSPPRHKRARRHRSSSSSSSIERDNDKRRTKHDKKRSDTKHRKHKKSSSRRKTTEHKTSHKTVKPKKPDTIWINETNLDPKEAYRIDTRSDPSNLHYDTLYSGDQASYKRYYGDRCLGLGRGQSIKFTDKRNRLVKKRQEASSTRYHEGVCLEPTETTELTFKEKQRKNYVSSNAVELEEEEEKENEKEAEQTNVEPRLPDILSLKVEVHQSNETSDERTLTPEVYMMNRTSHYNQLLADNPYDESLWQEFIAFQDEAIHWGKVPGAGRGGNETETGKKLHIALLERKVSIYERALIRNPNSVELLLGYMELVEQIWETEQLVAKWKNIVFFNANRSILWLKYIEFCISRFSFFQTNTIIAVFIKAISTLTSIAERKLVSHKPEVDAEKKILALYVYLCYFLRQSGYTERAVSSFQALIEFNLLYPEDLYPADCYYPRIGRRKGLQTFWESDEPRFGESTAVGWKNWEHRDKTPPSPLGVSLLSRFDKLLEESTLPKVSEPQDKEEEEEDIDITLVRGLPTNEAWLRLERYRDEENSLPGRMSAPVDSKMNSDTEDPEHITLYDDLIEIQFIMPDRELHYLLLQEFVRFLGAPCPGQSILQATFPGLNHVVTVPTEVMDTPPCMFSNLRLQGSHFSSSYFQPSPLGREYGIPLSSTMSEDLYCGVVCSEISSVVSERATFPSSSKHFVSTVFNQSLALVPKSNNAGMVLMCSWLHFELMHIHKLSRDGVDITEHVKQLHDLAMDLLNRASPLNYSFLWDFTSSLERLTPGDHEPSPLSKLLLSPFSRIAFPFNDMFSMALSFTECMLEMRKPMNCYLKWKPDRKLALYILVSLRGFELDIVNLPTKVPEVSPTEILKTDEFFVIQIRRVMAQINAKMISIKKDNFYIHYPKFACHACFLYLSQGLEQMFERCQRYEFEIKRIATDIAIPNHTTLIPLLENLYMLQARIVILHGAHTSTVKPQLLRGFIYRALELFPSHIWFLQNLLEVEKRSFISGRLRRFFESSLSKSVSVTPLLFAVRAELERRSHLMESITQGGYVEESLTGMLHRARALFRRGSELRSCRLCPAFWRCYMKFEIEQSNKEGAKAVFYQAIHHCPGVKVLYTDAIHYFPEEIEKILEITEEKLLRVRTPLDVIYLLQDDIQQRDTAKEKGADDTAT